MSFEGEEIKRMGSDGWTADGRADDRLCAYPEDLRRKT